MAVPSYVALIVVLVIGYISYKYLVTGPDIVNDAPPPPMSNSATAGNKNAMPEVNTRDPVEKMAAYKKNTIVFFGSQTGTAEDLASKLAKDLSSRLGLKTMTADLDDYDFNDFDKFPEKHLAVFVMASYGEGDPTDNAQEFYDFIKDPEFESGATELPDLNFTVFGLGNSSYEFFNKIGRDVHRRLGELGGKAVGPYGEGDDGTGTLEEDFMTWKEELCATLVSEWGLEEHEPVYEPTIDVTEEEIAPTSSDVYLGEPNLKHLLASKQKVMPPAPYTQSNPALAKVLAARNVFKGTDRQCIHMEFDATNLKYVTGDHLAFWPINSNVEIDRFFRAFGIKEPNQVIKISLIDCTSIIRVPSPTTYDTVVRHWLEINAPVSRSVLASVAPYAPSPEAKAKATKLASDKVLFAEEVTSKCYNIARLMLHISDNQPWDSVPFNFVIETIAPLQPRYYSISSSSLEDPSTISITAVVESSKPKNSDHEVKGVATNHILAMERRFSGHSDDSYELAGPRGQMTYDEHGVRGMIHVRHSLFKLPAKSTVPIIMVGAGTGVAPFRAFIRERGVMQSKGRECGPAMLFFGNRNRATDFLYEEEWPQYKDWLTVVTAFSRDCAEKVYVQHMLEKHSKEVNDLIMKGSMFYVCGDATKMARDVHKTLIRIIAKEQNLSREQAETIIRKMRSRDKYQEDVW
ncbi:NADPH--hemoprotein reductase [Starmerella bacillaris]|uniref:NADPH--cytochrome P450 reductase n=1 Tax=Starmerella bacillaris TaxID=1247836 RepID=A0AAV5RE77_STABA|nr:NADPH--hemoprotein reductase [Starmerella bacillaris]